MRRRSSAHSHRCTTCHESYDCGGNLWRNYDGWPETVCSIYHEHGETECAACFLAEACAYCGQKTEPLSEKDGSGDRYCVEGSACAKERAEAA